MSDLLLRTIHGSYLYNINHAGSDMDFYEVYTGKGKAKQTIIDGIDTVRISYDSFMHQCYKGVPQALEALYSRDKIVDKIPYIADSFVAASATVYKTYVRTINNFWESQSLKKKRHAIRLSLNLRDIMQYGRFNPALSDPDRTILDSLSVLKSDVCPGLTEPDILGFSQYIW